MSNKHPTVHNCNIDIGIDIITQNHQLDEYYNIYVFLPDYSGSFGNAQTHECTSANTGDCG